MAPTSSTERKGFFFLFVVLLLAGGYVLLPFFKTVILAIAVAVLFDPLHQKYLKWTKGRSSLSAFMGVGSVFLFLLIPITGVLTLLTAQLGSLIGSLTHNLINPSVSTMISQLETKLHLSSLHFDLFGVNLELIPLLRKGLERVASTLAHNSSHLMEDTFTFLLSIFIMSIVLFYLFKEGPHFFKTLVRLTPIKDKYEHRLADEIKKTINGVFYGSFLTSLVQSILATLGFYFIGINGFLVWGVLTFFMSFIPIIGTGAVFVPLIFLHLLQGEINKAIALAVYGAVVIGLVDNLLKPFLIRNNNIHPLFLFLSIFGGLAVFGPTGILLGPMIFAMLTATLRIYEKDFSATYLAPKKTEKLK